MDWLKIFVKALENRGFLKKYIFLKTLKECGSFKIFIRPLKNVDFLRPYRNYRTLVLVILHTI